MEEKEKNHEECCHCHCHEEEKSPLKKILISTILLVAGLVIEHLNPKEFFPDVEKITEYHKYAWMALYFLSFMVIGLEILKKAVYNLLHGDFFDEQFLMSVASVGALCIGEYPEAVAVMLFYQIGEYFEDFAVDKSKDSIEELMKICPDKANLLQDDGNTIEIPAEEIKTGDILVVKPGERIPADGIVVNGSSFLNNSALTGESVPVKVQEKDEVFSGSINENAAIQIKVIRLPQDSAASRIIKLVSESSEKKTKTERFITRFSRFYTPIVCSMAVLVAVIPPVISGLQNGTYEWSVWTYRALMFLVVSCPCAIVISVPLTYFGGIGSASRKGILLKGSSSIEAFSRLKTAVFDKTGTLTKGIFEVSEIHCKDNSIDEEKLLEIAAHAEKFSNHPAALSLKKAHNCQFCNTVKVENPEEIGGQGIKVILEGKTVLAGNEKLMENQNVKNYVPCENNDSGTIVHIAVEGEYYGHIVINDQVKEDSEEAVKKLKKCGVSNIVMLTGDNSKSAEATAKLLGITEVHSQLLPEDKVHKIEEILEAQKKAGIKGTTAFAGDGINDAPVLARADLGIAMGGLGSDAAIESADVVIMNDSIAKIAEGIKLSKKIKSIVYQNIIFSLGTKTAIMLLSGLGITNMWIAVFGDVGVTFLAILNSLRLLHK